MKFICVTLVIVALLSGADALRQEPLAPTAPKTRGTPGKTCDTFKDCEGCISSHFCLWSETKTACFDERVAKPDDKACHKCAPKNVTAPPPPPPPPVQKMDVECCDENERSLHQVVTAAIKDDLNGVVSGEAITIQRKPREELNYTAPEYRKVWMTKEEAKAKKDEAEKQAWTLKSQVEVKRLPVAENWKDYETRRQIELSNENDARGREDPSSHYLGRLQGPLIDPNKPEHPIVKADPLPSTAPPAVPEETPAEPANAPANDEATTTPEAEAPAEEKPAEPEAPAEEKPAEAAPAPAEEKPAEAAPESPAAPEAPAASNTTATTETTKAL